MLALALAPGAAWARNADGTLGLILAPHNGMPVIARPGDAFEVRLREEAPLQLEGAAVIPLETVWRLVPDGVAGTAVLPGTAPEGAYALSVPGRDRNVRAVYVRAEFPEVYSVAHITDTHVGSGRHPRASEAIVGEVFAAANASGAAFAVVTGDVTDSGTPEQFQAFLALLDTCTLPTFVQPGNHDRAQTHYERYFAPLVYRFRFGLDGYLAFDTKDYVVADGLTAQDGLLERYRRELKPVRWCVGLSHRYEASMGMRAQMVLFVDNPLDVLLFGHWHRENTEEEQVVPWGTTRMIVTPAAINGAYRVVDVTVQGLRPRPVEQAAETGAARPEPKP
jgi:predicted phosphodiesterase